MKVHCFRKIFNFLFWNHFRFIETLQRVKRFPHTLQQVSPDVNILHDHHAFFKTSLLALTKL